mmetsp:Transcript_5083/g.7741  ORF Transcript_5083/g.7741 Transcript_5083/m.7741 type:complete len:215 (+) Transcript_5083:280-924(+)
MLSLEAPHPRVYQVRCDERGQAFQPQLARSGGLDQTHSQGGEDWAQRHPGPQGHGLPHRLHRPCHPSSEEPAKCGERVRGGGAPPRRHSIHLHPDQGTGDPHRCPVPAPTADQCGEAPAPHPHHLPGKAPGLRLRPPPGRILGVLPGRDLRADPVRAPGPAHWHGGPHAGAAAREVWGAERERAPGDDARRPGRPVPVRHLQGRGLPAPRGQAP